MIRNVIRQMTTENFTSFRTELQKSKAEKFCQLLDCYRDGNLEDEEIQKITKTNNASYYTLRSRLQDKLQEYLFRITEHERAELLKTTATVPSLIHEKDRETAMMVLQYLETQLKDHDMPAELVVVYTALKNLHLHSPKYYEYQQRYNKNIAYMLAIDKADELLSQFSVELGFYLLSREASRRDVLQLFLKELNNYSRLYDSHRMKVLRGLAAASYGIFADESMVIPGSDETVEKLLNEIMAILESFPHDRNYRYYFSAVDFLKFEYYHRIGLHRNNQQEHDQLLSDPARVLRLSHKLPIGKFFLSSLERTASGNDTRNIKRERINRPVTPESDGEFSTFCILMYNAALQFNKGDYSSCCADLNNLINILSFKKFFCAELNSKLFLSLAYLLQGKADLSENLVRSMTRKMSSEDQTEELQAAEAFIRLLKTALSNASGKDKKLEKQLADFKALNKGTRTVLPFIAITPEHLKVMAR